MKYLIILATLLFSTPLLADSSFLSGLNFERIYTEKGNNQYEIIREKGISTDDFIKKMNDSKTTLGEKVALLGALSSYYEWSEKPKGSFSSYQKKFENSLNEIYRQNISAQNETIKPETRLLLQLMADYDTSSPKVEMYQMLAKKMPNSLTAQSVSVIAFAYDILYNNKNDFATVQDLKNNYLQPYYQNLENFQADVPVEVKKLCVDEILPYTFDCRGRLKCLVDTSSEKSLVLGLNELSKNIKENITSGTKLSDSYLDWSKSKSEALDWVNLQEKYVSKINATEVQKAEMRYFFNNKLYELMHNYDNLTNLFQESSFLKEMNTKKSKCKNDAQCAANAYLKSVEQDLEKQKITKKEVELLTMAKNKFENKFKNTSSDFGVDAVAGPGGSEPQYSFESAFDTLHFLRIYYYINPEKITEMYDLN